MDTTNELPIDRRAALARLGGDERIFDDFLDSVLSDSPRMLAEIRSALKGGRNDDAHCTAHGLKGMLAMLEARPATAAAYDVEQLTQKGKNAEASFATERLAAELDRLVKSIDQPTLLHSESP